MINIRMIYFIYKIVNKMFSTETKVKAHLTGNLFKFRLEYLFWEDIFEP